MSPLEFSALSERGMRERNDDAFCAEKIGSYHLFAIAEGLPTHPYGDLASRTAIDALRAVVGKTKGSAQEILIAGIRQAEADVRVLAQLPKHTGLATTLVACLVDTKMNCTVLDIGDRNCMVITKSSTDNARTIAKARHLPGSPAAAHPAPRPPALSDMISHVLGEPYRMKDADFPVFVLGNEFLLISSGGLTDVLDKEAIAGIIRKNEGSIDAACETLVQEAMKAGSERTISVVLVHGSRDA